MALEINASTCSVCTACDPVCPNSAIRMKGGIYIVLNRQEKPSFCRQRPCRHCAKSDRREADFWRSFRPLFGRSDGRSAH